jgi:hypothetical protein
MATTLLAQTIALVGGYAASILAHTYMLVVCCSNTLAAGFWCITLHLYGGPATTDRTAGHGFIFPRTLVGAKLSEGCISKSLGYPAASLFLGNTGGRTAASSFYIGRWLVRDTYFSTNQAARFAYDVAGNLVYWLFLGLGIICYAIAVLRFRLWDIDPIISRVIAYLILTITLVLISIASSVLLEQLFTIRLSGTLQVAITIASIIAVVSFYRRLQHWLDRRFNRQWIDARESLRHFADQIGTMTDLAQLQQMLPLQVAQIHRIEYSTLLMRDAQEHYTIAHTFGTHDHPTLAAPIITQLQHGLVIQQPNAPWPLVLPLRVPQPNGPLSLIGMLALGPHKSGRPFDRADQEVLQLLADRAASALAVASLLANQRQNEGQSRIIDPYLPNRPLAANSPLFVGRSADLAFLVEQLTRGVSVVLTGEHRMGKTSLLQQLPSYLEPTCLSVSIDGQRLIVGGGLVQLCHELATELTLAVGLAPPPYADFRERPG